MVSPPIGQALSDRAIEGFIVAGAVVKAQQNAGVMAEAELGDAAVQVLFRAMLIDALHALLEDAEEAFC